MPRRLHYSVRGKSLKLKYTSCIIELYFNKALRELFIKKLKKKMLKSCYIGEQKKKKITMHTLLITSYTIRGWKRALRGSGAVRSLQSVKHRERERAII